MLWRSEVLCKLLGVLQGGGNGVERGDYREGGRVWVRSVIDELLCCRTAVL